MIGLTFQMVDGSEVNVHASKTITLEFQRNGFSINISQGDSKPIGILYENCVSVQASNFEGGKPPLS